MNYVKVSPVARFLSHVSLPIDERKCWMWTGTVNTIGYGVFRLHGRSMSAQRAAMVLLAGIDVPPDLCVCHHCDVPLCVNPRHMFIGTHQDNTNDAIIKGRISWRPRPIKVFRNRGKMTPEQRDQALRLRDAGMGYSAIGRQFGVSHTAIQNLEERRNSAKRLSGVAKANLELSNQDQ